MATVEARIEALEKRVAAIEKAISPEARLESGKIAFGGRTAVHEGESAIPNTMFDPPSVPVAQAVYLAYLRHKDGSEGWYGLRGSGTMGEVVPYPPQLKAVAERCGTYKDGDYTVVSFDKVLSVDDVILRKIRNPILPVPKGCKIINEWELVPE